jgi:rubrerythrin
MDRELAVLVNSLTDEGKEKLANTISDYVLATDIIDGFYKEAKEVDKGYRSVVPKGAGRYALGYIAGSTLTPIAEALLPLLSKKKMNPRVAEAIQKIVPDLVNPNNVGIMTATPSIVKDISHNTKLKNQDREALNKFMNRQASEVIDELFKQAKMEVPTPLEAKKESQPKKQPDDRPNIKCEVCGYEGKATVKGQCPECGAIMGVKPAEYPVPYTPIWTGEPMSGISVNEASIRGKIEEAW